MSPMYTKEALDIEAVAVIGAGPCGLAAAKYLLAENKFSKVEIFEQRDTIGGIWTYSPLNIVDNNFTVPRTDPSQLPDTAIHVKDCDVPKFVSPVYEFLETNIPHTLMNYSDQRFPQGTSLFPAHTVVKEYLSTYAESLGPVLSLSTQILSVTKIQNGTKKQWEVESLDLASNTKKKAFFDAVLIASGHYNDPFIPDIPGLSEFNKTYPGSVSHSKFYRNPLQYKDKKVVVVGNSASGIDLSSQLSTVCKRPVIVSEKSTPNTPSEQTPDLRIATEIVKVDTEGRTLFFADGSIERDVDAIVFCTGYFYTYPFLKELSPPVTTNGSHVQRLYEHILYMDDPTLAFAGVPQRVVPFPVSEAQSAWVARIWADRLDLPSEAEMREWEAQTYQNGAADKSVHNLAFPKDVNYINRLYSRSMSAIKKAELDNDGVGKLPPYWDSEAAWVRERFPLIKIASRKLGERKHEVKSLADLGFVYQSEDAASIAERKLL